MSVLAAEREQARLTLPEDVVEAKVVRYESHLNRPLIQCPHELQRNQADRAGHPVPLAVEVGVNVTTDTKGAGSDDNAPA